MAPIKDGTYEFDKDSLVEIRKRMGVSQSKMAEFLGVPANTLSRWETGVTVPDASSLAAVYSVAKDHGIDPPPFIAMRRTSLTLRMSSKPSDQAAESLAFFELLRSFLNARIELVGSESKPVISVEITNTAPTTPGWPKVVFMGVGLSLAHTGEVWSAGTPPNTRISRRSVERVESVVATPWQNDSKMQGLLRIGYDGVGDKRASFPDVMPYEAEFGEVLFPGQSVVYDIDTTPEVLPYLQFRIECTASPRHLFHYEEAFAMPESITKPLVLSAINDLAGIDMYGPLKAVVSSMPVFDGNTRLTVVQAFSKVLTTKIADVRGVQKEIQQAFGQHKLNRFRAHLRAAFIYLDRVAESLARMKEALASGVSDKIAAEASAMKALEEEGAQLDRETQALMREYNISREEIRPAPRSS